MVSLKEVQLSNSLIASKLPARLVAVFVGATRGIGEIALKQFVRDTVRPRIYFVGRSKENGERVKRELQKLNVDGEYTFMAADTSLIRNVDEICREIKQKETAVNLLFITSGTLVTYTKTPENLHYAASVIYYSRTRFIANLLPLLSSATTLRRVVSVFAGTKEGEVFPHDIPAWKVPLRSCRGHVASLITLSHEAFAKKAPSVSFIHNFPGHVKTDLLKEPPGVVFGVLRAVTRVTGLFTDFMSEQECGDRHVYLATSSRYAASDGGGAGIVEGIPLADGVCVAARINGSEKGCGAVYSVDEDGEAAGPEVEQLMAKLRVEGMVEKVWKHTSDEFERITGVEAV